MRPFVQSAESGYSRNQSVMTFGQRIDLGARHPGDPELLTAEVGMTAAC
jgi:hypothetical protein